VRKHGGALAIAAVALVYLIPVQYLGWNQGAQYALVRALAEGTPRVDQTRFEVGKGGMNSDGTGDLSLIHGHYYAAKSPGLAFESLAPYLVLEAAGHSKPVRESRGPVWFLNLWGALLPAVLLLVLVRYVAERLEPGFGTAAAVTLGLTTMVLPFATMFFSHILSATLAFAAFAVLWRERRGPPRLLPVLCAGVLAGLAATVEFPVAMIGAILCFYAVARPSLPRRLVAYMGGAVIGGLPTLLFNLWAFGSMFKFSYANVVGEEGANKVGFFGITAPKFHVLVELLFQPIGLLVLTPVVALGAVGLAFLYRRGHPAEALLAATITLVYLLMNAGYETPFGGNSPGPRFLVAIMPFLALGFAASYRRLPLTTTALAVGSSVEMVALTLTNPLGTDDLGWFHRFASGQFVETALDLAGIHHGAIPLFFAGLVVAVVLVLLVSARPEASWRDAARAPLAVGAWILVAHKAPHMLENSGDGPWAALGLAQAVILAVVVAPQLVARATAPPEGALGR
jgi:hypothetical protein